MRFMTICTVALELAITNAFKDTSPFFLVSTTKLVDSSQNILSASSLSRAILPELEKCPSDAYVIVSQPGVNAADYVDKSATPHLRMLARREERKVRSSFAVKDVVGTLDVEEISRTLEEKCKAGYMRIDASTGSFALSEDMRPRVITVDFPNLPHTSKERALKLTENDAFLSSLLDMLPSPSYTLLYTTSPYSHKAATAQPSKIEHESYHVEPSFHQSQAHMELKRDFSPNGDNAKRATEDSKDTQVKLPDGPLFERYQFLSPGIFMGIIVVLIFVTVVSVGMNGVGSLLVSYQAFDRDTGPAAQGGGGKKQN